jgi:Family of unknown function (DUF6527)
MGVKLKQYGPGLYVFHCPGCGFDHPFHVLPAKTRKGESWKWNGSLDKPTFAPSLLVNKDYPAQRCHSYVTNGQIKFLTDCWHSLKGKTVEIPDWGSPC